MKKTGTVHLQTHVEPWLRPLLVERLRSTGKTPYAYLRELVRSDLMNAKPNDPMSP